MVSTAAQFSRQGLDISKETRQPEQSRTPNFYEHFTTESNIIKGIPFLQESLQKEGIDPITLEYFNKTWRSSTQKAYKSHLERWAKWTQINSVDPIAPSVANILKILRKYFETGVGHGAINSARCALSLIIPLVNGKTIGENRLICWFIKACYEKRPPQPKYTDFWSVQVVLDWITSLGSNTNMSLKTLSLKLTMLLLLVSAQRGQTILALQLDKMVLKTNVTLFKMKTLLKHNQMGDPLDSVSFYNFNENKLVCVVATLKAYVARTKLLRGETTQLLITHNKPHRPIARATLARWTIQALEQAGVDIYFYKAHSTRGAAASSAHALGVNLNAIMKQASWRDAKSFAKHYNRTIVNPAEMQQRVLRLSKKSKR